VVKIIIVEEALFNRAILDKRGAIAISLLYAQNRPLSYCLRKPPIKYVC